MKDWYNKYPPYEGREPYLYLAFAEADRGKVWEVMRLLLERGCRVWFNRGSAGGSEEVLRRQERCGNAALTLVYLSDEACRDQNTKSSVLVFQKSDKPIICLDPDSKDRRLAMGLRESIPHIPLYQYKSREELEDAILHAEGFSQVLIGKPVTISGNGIFRGFSILFCVLALVLAGLFFSAAREVGIQTQEVQDHVVISDPVISRAMREAAGKGPINEELTSGITVLTLDGMPESWDELSLLPSLKEIRIPQEALLGDDPLPEGDYTIILLGGGT